MTDLTTRQELVLQRIIAASRWLGGMPTLFLAQRDLRAAETLADLAMAELLALQMPNGETVMAYRAVQS